MVNRSTILLRQMFVMTSVMFQTFMCGFNIGYPTTLIATLLHEDSEIKLDKDSSSTIVAVRGIGFMIIVILSHIVMEKYGRKLTQFMFVIPGIAGWTICYFAQTVQHLVAFPILLGLQLGVSLATASLVIGEYSTPTLRGIFLIANSAVVATGIAIIHILGGYVYWRTITLVAYVPHVLCCVMVPFWPESPYWLARNGRFEECTKAFHWLRGEDGEALIELEDLIKEKERLQIEKNQQGIIITIKRNMIYLKKKAFWKPVIAIVMLNNLVELSGRYVIVTYSISIISSMINYESIAYKLLMITDVMCLVLNFLATILVKAMKRRTLLFSSTSICIISLYICSLVLYLHSKSLVPNYCSWIGIFFFVLFIGASSIGVLPVVIGTFGEILPLIYKAAAGIICGLYGVILNSILGKVTPYIMNSMGPEETFLIFAICMSLCAIFLFKFLPETKDKSLQDIEKIWEDRCSRAKFTNNTELLLLKK